MPLFTIMLPIVRPPAMLPYAVKSVQSQTITDWELFIILDGAPPETLAVATQLAAEDPRIKVRPFAKGERNGEAHRHVVLGEATGSYVAQIADDDLWFPRHLAELRLLLSEVDFGNLLQCEIFPDGRPKILFGDLASAKMRRAMLTDLVSFFGPSCAGYRRAAYDRLPVGWSPAPPGIWSDLYMWRKFLAVAEVRAATRFSIEAAKIESPVRHHMTMEARAAETAALAERIGTADGRADIRANALRNAIWVRAARHTPTSSARERARRMWRVLRDFE
ncbi:glycosyltransferase family 2 protein [Sphingomonas sp. Tas61C01]|uniref:glycosyltransferase family 2 protein n=1 Tax=Sphingomonas sp. Tas61C01 TaxID=3458297 RepID=UPI00403EB026